MVLKKIDMPSVSQEFAVFPDDESLNKIQNDIQLILKKKKSVMCRKLEVYRE